MPVLEGVPVAVFAGGDIREQTRAKFDQALCHWALALALMEPLKREEG